MYRIVFHGIPGVILRDEGYSRSVQRFVWARRNNKLYLHLFLWLLYLYDSRSFLFGVQTVGMRICIHLLNEFSVHSWFKKWRGCFIGGKYVYIWGRLVLGRKLQGNIVKITIRHTCRKKVKLKIFVMYVYDAAPAEWWGIFSVLRLHREKCYVEHFLYFFRRLWRLQVYMYISFW